MAGWMAVIFSFSAQVAEESSELSGSFAYEVVDATGKMLGKGWEISQVLSYAEKIEYLVRKLAHMTEYAILALLAYAFYVSMEVKGRKKYLASLATASLYAVTDEVHQLFVAGRSGSFRDVCIDTAGAALALLLVSFIGKIAGKHCEKRKLSIQ